MNVFIIGATGLVGTAVDEALTRRGHRVVGAARSDAAATALNARGTEFVRADAAQPNSLLKAVASADTVVYATNVTDADALRVDGNAVRAIVKTLAGTEKTFVYTSTAWVYGPTDTGPVSETATLAPPAIAAKRVDFERFVLNSVNFGVRAFVIRPGIVYGGRGGTPSMFVQSALERGAATIVGDGANRWATVAAADLGELYLLACERGRPGCYNGTDGTTFTQREIAEAASRGAGAAGAVTVVPPELLGPFGEALALDQAVSSNRAVRELGWQPSANTIIEELEGGRYLAVA